MRKQDLIKEAFVNGFTYGDYRIHTLNRLEQYHKEGKDSLFNYTRLNEQRMLRLDKTIELSPSVVEAVEGTLSNKWLVITEPWCGDAAQLVPLFNKLAEANGNVEIRFTLRDSSTELMDHFEINGSRAIPVIIFLDDDYNVLGRWGARPEEAQSFVEEYKKMTDKPPYEELTLKLQKWYNLDKTKSSQLEITNLLNGMKQTEVAA